MTAYEAAYTWLLYLSLWLNAEPGTARYFACQRHMRRLEREYGLKRMSLIDLPNVPHLTTLMRPRRERKAVRA